MTDDPSLDHEPTHGAVVVNVARDAEWMLAAAPLVTDEIWKSVGARGATCSRWQLPSQTPPSTLQHVTARLPLGHHFERVHAWVLGSQTCVEPVAFNVAVRSHESGVPTTMGEIDCLYRSREGEGIVHREVAVKYYLGREDAERPDAWWGPGKRDRLDLKLERLLRHQAVLPILARKAAAWPPELPYPDRDEVLLRGSFFKHPSHGHWPEVIHAEAERGFWCTAREWLETSARFEHWLVLPKLAWLAGVPARPLPLQTAQGIAAEVERTQQPVMVKPGFASGGPRGFIVPQSWLNDD